MNETERFNTFVLLVSRAYKSLRRAQEKYTRAFGLRSVHVTCMLQLHAAESGLNATELSRMCGVDRAQISRVVSELEGAGLVRASEPGEKRRYRGVLELTERGREMAAGMDAIVSEKLDAVASGLDSADVETFYKVFRQIADRLDEV